MYGNVLDIARLKQDRYFEIIFYENRKNKCEKREKVKQCHELIFTRCFHINRVTESKRKMFQIMEYRYGYVECRNVSMFFIYKVIHCQWYWQFIKKIFRAE